MAWVVAEPPRQTVSDRPGRMCASSPNNRGSAWSGTAQGGGGEANLVHTMVQLTAFTNIVNFPGVPTAGPRRQQLLSSRAPGSPASHQQLVPTPTSFISGGKSNEHHPFGARRRHGALIRAAGRIPGRPSPGHRSRCACCRRLLGLLRFAVACQSHHPFGLGGP